MSPSDEHMDYVNTPGQRKYVLMEEDPATNKKNGLDQKFMPIHYFMYQDH